MSEFDSSRVRTEFRQGVTTTSPIYNRAYTVTHSDETGELFLTIGTEHAYDKIDELRDEVLIQIKTIDGRLMFYGTVLISEEGDSRDKKMRNEIFMRELPLAIEALKEADRGFFEMHPMLLELPVCIWFRSNDDQYNQFYDFGPIRVMKMSSSK